MSAAALSRPAWSYSGREKTVTAQSFRMKKHFLLLLLLLASGLAWATDQPLADKVVGYWISSSGTPLTIAYSGRPEKAMLQIGKQPNIDLWLAGGARGELTLDYETAAGEKMQGTYNESNDTIEVVSRKGNFKAVWSRRK